MHISLDSALGRQRRLNSVGESVLQIAPNAAAAYSLRSLTGGDPKVVRVRRGSDNHEQDFTASGVSSGALTSFVNAQVTPPLDIRALSATGRDGDFLIAKAAYSLRSLGTRQATLAATGDTVARANGKFVAQVRRSTDDALKSFTATEVTDGTLVSFATSGNGVFQNTGFESFTNASASGFTASNTAGSGFAISDIADGVSGDVVKVSFDIDITNGSPKLSLRSAMDGGSQESNSITYTSSGSKTATLTATGNYVGIGFPENNAPSNFTVSNFKILGDGFVKTWYDQSVDQAGTAATGNHAVQSTDASQPKIVSAGALVTVGVDFTDGKLMEFTSISAKTVVGVNQLTDTTNLSYLVGRTSDDKGVRTSGGLFLGADTGSGGTGDFNNSGGSTHVNGSQSSFSATSKNVYFGTATSGFSLTSLSTAFSASGTLRAWRGKIAEVIVYDTDQSDNRTALEANIGEVYNINLPAGVDPLNNEVDGFVETWYDQSGNNRPLIQATASEQPLIVEAGTFLNGVKANKATSNDTMQNMQVSTDGTNANFGTDDWASGASLKLGAVYVGTVPADSVTDPVQNAIILGGGRGVGGFQAGGVALTVVKAGTDDWKIRNERQGLSPSGTENSTSLNTDADVVLYGTTDNREFTINVNGSGDTDTVSADLDVRSTVPLSLFGAYGQTAGAFYQRSAGGICKECYLYAGDPVANIPALATSINSHYSIY